MSECNSEKCEQIMDVAVKKVMVPVLALLQNDNHAWSKRPCSTCRAVTSIVGEPFGCVLYAEQEASRK